MLRFSLLLEHNPLIIIGCYSEALEITSLCEMPLFVTLLTMLFVASFLFIKSIINPVWLMKTGIFFFFLFSWLHFEVTKMYFVTFKCFTCFFNIHWRRAFLLFTLVCLNLNYGQINRITWKYIYISSLHHSFENVILISVCLKIGLGVKTDAFFLRTYDINSTCNCYGLKIVNGFAMALTFLEDSNLDFKICFFSTKIF